ncbi:winged helix-turn-helix domain-containing protein [Streptomyces caatingaensis]|uniref:winged helix-turn-helix domain-containing protein n=1 Tax=Streptomyces caatingaensis TaxID=1678637 RepID=UPI00069D3937|nr:winged helix-turn-helix domain-containing protein [Streptomyces caatingaensis]
MSLHYPRALRNHFPHPAPAAAHGRRHAAAPAADGITIDYKRRTAVAGGREIRLTFVEFELLAHLVTRPLQVHTRRQLMASVWGPTALGGGRTVDVHIARLRGKLGPGYRETILTVRHVGYAYDPSRLGPAASRTGA